MKFTADRATFAEALKWVTLAVPVRPLMPELAGVRITAEDQTLSLLAHDGHTMHEARIDAEVEEAGQSVPVGLVLRDLVGAFKSKTVQGVTTDRTFDLSTLNAKGKVGSAYSVAAFTETPYPAPPEGDAEDVGTVYAEELLRALKTVAHAADDDNPVSRLKGVRLEAVVGKVSEFRVVALRTSCISVSRTDWPTDAKPFSIQLPIRGVLEATRGLSGAVDIAAGSAVLRLSDEARTVTLRIYDGTPADWSQVIPALGTQRVSVESESLLDAVKRAAVTCATDLVPVYIDVSDGELTVRAGSSDTATGTELLDVDGSGTYVSGYSADLLTSIVSALPVGPVDLHFGFAEGASAGGRIAPMQVLVGRDHHVVMPRKAAS